MDAGKDGKLVAFGTLQELRDQFGSLTCRICFSIDNPGKVIGHTMTCRQEGGLFICEAEDMKELNESTGIIAYDGGCVEQIESSYPSPEEMHVRIGM